MDDGFLILREVITPDLLEPLRVSFETLVDRQRATWKQAGNDVWETGGQPRLVFQQFVDESTADAVEMCLAETTLGVCRQVMGTPDAALVAMFFMCSPVTDHGPANWHRDVGPRRQAPLHGLQRDLLDNAQATSSGTSRSTTTRSYGLFQAAIGGRTPRRSAIGSGRMRRPRCPARCRSS
jgi:hypothetical protein